MNIKEAIQEVCSRKHLSRDHTQEVFGHIMGGEATEAQIAALIVALRMKGETVEEITGAAEVMREKATHVIPDNPEHVVDTCGTGGDRSHTFNISTAAAFVAAGAGATVAKHGNRSVSSKSGSADVLEALGVNVAVGPETMKECLDTIGICFLFAPALHKAMKFAIGPRKEIAVRTIFNVLGPLTNPSKASTQLMGVFAPELTDQLARVLNNMGSRKAFVVHSRDGLDEISLSAPTLVCELSEGEVKSFEVSPEQYGLKPASLDQVVGGDAAQNAAVIRDVLGKKKGPARDIVLLNAGFAVAASGIAATPQEGIALAAEAIDSGKAREKLESLVKLTSA